MTYQGRRTKPPPSLLELGGLAASTERIDEMPEVARDGIERHQQQIAQRKVFEDHEKAIAFHVVSFERGCACPRNANSDVLRWPPERTGIPSRPSARAGRDRCPRNTKRSSHRRGRFPPAFRGDTKPPSRSATAPLRYARRTREIPDGHAACCFHPDRAACPRNPAGRRSQGGLATHTCRRRAAARWPQSKLPASPDERWRHHSEQRGRERTTRRKA